PLTAISSTSSFSIAASTLGERIVAGLDPFSNQGGWFASRKGPDGSFNAGPWPLLPWSAYDTTGGRLHVAAGDLAGDGLADAVPGLGSGGQGWIAVFGDSAHGFAFLKWIQVSWPTYNNLNGEVWPAVGDIDGDGKAEIVAGLGAGGQGYFQIFDDASNN